MRILIILIKDFLEIKFMEIMKKWNKKIIKLSFNNFFNINFNNNNIILYDFPYKLFK